MKTPIERLLDSAIKKLPKPSPEALAIWSKLTDFQISNLVEMFPYLHGASHGYGQAGPTRRKLQDKGLIVPYEDGWKPTPLGYEVIAIHFQIVERKDDDDTEIREIIRICKEVVTSNDWNPLMIALKSSKKPDRAIALIKRFIPGIIYQSDEKSKFGMSFILPTPLDVSLPLKSAIKKSETTEVLSYRM